MEALRGSHKRPDTDNRTPPKGVCPPVRMSGLADVVDIPDFVRVVRVVPGSGAERYGAFKIKKASAATRPNRFSKSH